MALEIGSTAASLGSSLGQGITGALGLLAEQKMQDMQERRKELTQKRERERIAAGLEPVVGQKTAQFLSNLDPKERMNAWYNLPEIQAYLGEGSFQQPATGLETLAQPGIQQQMQPVQGSTLDKLLQLQGAPTQGAGFGALKPQIVPEKQPKQRAIAPEIQPKKAELLRNIFQKPMTPYQQEMLNVTNRNVLTKESKEARDFIKPIHEASQKARESAKDYKALIKLADSGKLRAGTQHGLLSKLGLQDFYRNIETETADKITNRLKQNIAGVFGSNARVTNFLETTFQKSLPSLWNTPQGIKLISKMNLLTGEAAQLKDDVTKEIIRENNGRIPYDIDYQVDERIAPRLNQIEDETIRLVETGGKTAQTFDTLPNPAELKGKRIRDTETGKFFKSNGSKWIPEE